MVELTDSIPPDPTEEAQRLSTLTVAELQSRRRSVRELHPDMSPEQVEEELMEIRADTSMEIMPVPALVDEPETPDSPDDN